MCSTVRSGENTEKLENKKPYLVARPIEEEMWIHPVFGAE